MTIKIKSGEELSAMTSEIIARTITREAVKCPEPAWVRLGLMPLVYAVVAGAFYWFLWEGF